MKYKYWLLHLSTYQLDKRNTLMHQVVNTCLVGKKCTQMTAIREKRSQLRKGYRLYWWHLTVFPKKFESIQRCKHIKWR